MSSLFFTADLHIGHRSIIDFESERRPFQSVEEHDDAVISNWNETVKSDLDVVWVLGDVIWRGVDPAILDSLRGRKRLVIGNHDDSRIYPYFDEVWGARPFRKGAVLSHIPIHTGSMDRWRWNIHGHLHSKVVGDDRYINVSLEQTGLRPISWEDVQDIMTFRTQPPASA